MFWQLDPDLMDLMSLLQCIIGAQLILACPLFGFDSLSDRPPASPLMRFRVFFYYTGLFFVYLQMIFTWNQQNTFIALYNARFMYIFEVNVQAIFVRSIEFTLCALQGWNFVWNSLNLNIFNLKHYLIKVFL